VQGIEAGAPSFGMQLTLAAAPMVHHIGLPPVLAKLHYRCAPIWVLALDPVPCLGEHMADILREIGEG